VGSNAHADKINLREMAGVDKPRKMQGKAPNLLRGMDFIDMPKSKPLGQVDMDGMELPEMPQERPVDFAPVPQELQQHVQSQLENLNDNPRERTVEPSAPIPTPSPEMDFDLFQFSMISDMIKKFDISIKAMDSAMAEMVQNRQMLIELIKGDTKSKEESDNDQT